MESEMPDIMAPPHRVLIDEEMTGIIEAVIEASTIPQQLSNR
jgi:hypothetical protein